MIAAILIALFLLPQSATDITDRMRLARELAEIGMYPIPQDHLLLTAEWQYPYPNVEPVHRWLFHIRGSIDAGDIPAIMASQMAHQMYFLYSAKMDSVQIQVAAQDTLLRTGPFSIWSESYPEEEE